MHLIATVLLGGFLCNQGRQSQGDDIEEWKALHPGTGPDSYDLAMLSELDSSIVFLERHSNVFLASHVR